MIKLKLLNGENVECVIPYYKKGYKIEGQFQDEIISKLEEKRSAEIA